MDKTVRFVFFLSISVFLSKNVKAQTNLFLNGSFEDINICSEYDAECGVEGWFYLKDIKVQMISNYDPVLSLGNNSYGLLYRWKEYSGFTPVIGTILPCHLQEGKEYIFKGLISVKTPVWLRFTAGVAVGEFFYVPKRPFSAGMQPDSIVQVKPLGRKDFYEFEYRFVANGKEKYLTFGSFAVADETTGKKARIGDPKISMILDNFQLLPVDGQEGPCLHYDLNKGAIYHYNYRHKEMDYSLYGKGDLGIKFHTPDSNDITRYQPTPDIVEADTLKLGDVFFDFNKSTLKPEAIRMLNGFFKAGGTTIDSIYIEGHTDSIGGAGQNMQLSMRRCESVQAWLIDNKVADKTNLSIHPFGKTRPIASNATARGRALNRRVEIIIFRKQDR